MTVSLPTWLPVPVEQAGTSLALPASSPKASTVGITGMRFPSDDTAFKGLVWVMEITHFLSYSRIGNYSGLWILLQFNAAHMFQLPSIRVFWQVQTSNMEIKRLKWLSDKPEAYFCPSAIQLHSQTIILRLPNDLKKKKKLSVLLQIWKYCGWFPTSRLK